MESFSSFDESACEPTSGKGWLKEQNRRLNEENERLKEQFDQAMAVTEQVEKLHADNSELSSQIRLLKNEKDDLAHRLEISQQAARDSNDRLTEYKRSSQTRVSSEQGRVEQEMNRVRRHFQDEANKWKGAYEEEKQARDEAAVAYSVIANRVECLVQSGERYFGTQLKGLDALVDALSQPRVVHEKRVSEPAPVSASDVKHVETLEKKLKQAKAKLRAASREQASNEERIGDAAKEAREMAVAFKREQDRLKGQIAALAEENKTIEEKYACEWERSQAELESTRADVARLKQERAKMLQTPVQAYVPASVQPVQMATQVEKEYRITQEKLMQTVAELRDEVSLTEKKRDEMVEKAKASELESQKLLTAIEKQKCEISSLTTIGKEARAEIDSLRAALSAKQQPEPVPQKPQKKDVEKKARLMKDLESQRDRVRTLTGECARKKVALDDALAKIKSLEDDVANVERRAQQSVDELREYKLCCESKRVPTVEDLLPADAFRCNEFAASLASQLNKIAINPSLQPASKIKNAYRAISQYYEGFVNDIQAQLASMMRESEGVKGLANELLVNASIALNDKAITLSDACSGAGEGFIQDIANLRARYDAALHQIDVLEGVVALFRNLFNPDEGDPITQITNVKQEADKQASAFAKKKQKYTQLRGVLLRLRNEFRKTAEEHDAECHEMKEKIYELEVCKGELGSLLKKFRAHNQQLEQDLSDERSANNEAAKATAEEHDGAVNELATEKARIQAQFRKDIDIAQRNYDNLDAQYQECEAEVTKLRKRAQTQDALLKRYEGEIENLRQVIDENEVQAQERLETEKEQLTDSMNGAIAELQAQCERHRELVQTMTASVATVENKLQGSTQNAQALHKEKQRLIYELDQLRKQFDRDRKLSESQMKAKLLAIDSQYNIKLADECSRADREQRSLCAYVADAFRSFFDPNLPIDPSSFKALVERIKEELARLTGGETAIRRMIGAQEGQTTQDAVACFVMECSEQ